ncbi:MAG TPA: FAD-dependent oxidoreductase [Candidatus Saccharimonadia bacterium]|nr:FAD-dependent oxidoreductase [Candidatus Saccharimonadia bacterium]
MDLRSGHAFWLIRNGILNAFPAPDKDLRCDVVVVGGGISGALVGYHLAEAGISAVVLDRRDIGWGSTSASTALLQYEIDTPLVELKERFGKETGERCYQSCRDAIYKLQDLAQKLDDHCGFSLKPSLFIAKRARDVAFMKREFKARTDAGFTVEWWNGADVKRHMGFTRPCGIYSQDGAQVDAYRLTHRLLEKAQTLGLRIFDRTEVLDYRVTGSRVKVKTDRGVTINAKHIVFATGYEFEQLSDRNLVKLHSTFAMVSEPLGAGKHLWHDNCLIWEHAEPYLYIRTTDDHRILVGGEDEDFRDPEKRDGMIAKKSATLQRKFRHLFPGIKLEPAFCWAGTFGSTEDGLAYIGEIPEFPRALFALGFGGNGITYSVLAAEIIRDQILGKSNPYSDLYRFDRHGGNARSG